ncbi:MAG: LytTR family DNA-binding domain-containing protein [Pseudomonadota bacterium]
MKSTLEQRFLQFFFKHERAGLVVLIVMCMLVQNTINATSIMLEAQRNGVFIPFWEPFVRDYSSALALLPMVAFILWLNQRFPFSWVQWRQMIALHLFGSLIFCIGHMFFMYFLRVFAMRLLGSDYQWDNLLFEFIYEYRKDAWIYVMFTALFYSYYFTLGRLRGEASMIGEGEDSDVHNLDKGTLPDRLLIKKLGKEFIIKIKDIEWMESSGNYVNLHIQGRVYPLRTTLSKLSEQLESQGFMRVHRSYGVNLEQIDTIEPQDSGDAVIKLKSSQHINLSRRYREAFRNRLRLDA